MLFQTRGRESMAREPDVALLITASGSFVAKHKLPHIKENDDDDDILFMLSISIRNVQYCEA